MTSVAGCRAALHHTVRTLGGILQKQNSTAAVGIVEGTELEPLSSSALCQGDAACGRGRALGVCRGANMRQGSAALCFCLLPNSAVYDSERRMSRFLLACMLALFSVQSQLDSVLLLNKYLLNLLLTTIQLIRPGIT